MGSKIYALIIVTFILVLALDQQTFSQSRADLTKSTMQNQNNSAAPAKTKAPENHIVKVRIKDITDLHGLRNNILSGIGIVTGLQGTGDSQTATKQAMLNMVRKYNLNVSVNEISSSNAALVDVHAVLTPGLRNGNRIDVTVTSPHDATSLLGGYLSMTPLTGGSTNTVYAVAEGPLMVGGFSASGSASSILAGRSRFRKIIQLWPQSQEGPQLKENFP